MQLESGTVKLEELTRRQKAKSVDGQRNLHCILWAGSHYGKS